MPKFKEFEIIASIDGVGTVNDYCRFPSKWSQISENYDTVKNLMAEHPNVKILVNITVNLLNVMNVDSLLYWIDEKAKQHPYYKEWPYNINLIVYPSDQRIDHLPLELRKITIDRLLEYKKNSRVLKEFPELSSKIDLIINELKKEFTLENQWYLEQFIKRISVLNAHRGVKVTDYIPDLKKVFVNELE